MYKILILLFLSVSSYAQIWEGRFAATDKYQKYIALGYQQKTSIDGLIFGATVGTLNRSNILTLDYNPFIELNIGYRIVSKGFYGYIQQGAAFVSPPLQLMMATPYQFPTSVSFGLESEMGHLGIFWSHFSNGTKMRGNHAFEVMGICFGKTF